MDVSGLGINADLLFLVDFHLVLPSLLELSLLIAVFLELACFLLLKTDVVRINHKVFKHTLHLDLLLCGDFLGFDLI